MKPDDFGRFGCEFDFIALAPGFAPGKVDLLRPQKTPDVLKHRHRRPLWRSRAAPAPITSRRRAVQHSQNALAGLGSVLVRHPARGFVETRKSPLRIAHPPLRCGAGRAANRPSNCSRRCTIRRQQDDPRSPIQSMLSFGRARQAVTLRTLSLRRYDRSRFRDAAHAALNHNSSMSDSGFCSYGGMHSPSRPLAATEIRYLDAQRQYR